MGYFDNNYVFRARMALIKTQLLYKRFFKKIGKHTRILKPLRIANSKYISLGNNVYIDSLAFLTADDSNNNIPELIIGDDVKIGNMNHITSVNSVVIENGVLTADRVYISDNYHIYIDPNVPIKMQGVASKGRTVIGEGSWIGDNVSIISCEIGKHCIIGANSVVTHDIPDYSLAVGAPAKAIKKYDFSTGKWVEVCNQ